MGQDLIFQSLLTFGRLMQSNSCHRSMRDSPHNAMANIMVKHKMGWNQ
jgi:hypothetical protein